MTFEKMICEINPNKSSEVIMNNCDIRNVNRTHIRMNFEANFLRPFHSGYLHSILYRKFTANVYRKFLVNSFCFCCLIIYFVWFYKNYSHRQWNFSIFLFVKVDLWEDGCAWLDGSGKSWFLDFTMRKALGYIDTNMYHKCPFEGKIYLKTNSIALNTFTIVEQLFPSGRYMVEITFYEHRNDSQWFAKVKLYLEISDRRIEQF